MQEGNFETRGKLRYNLITVTIYVVGVILLLQLFNLQIVNGEEYRKKSNTRLSRESTLLAARGSYLDRTGTVIAATTNSSKIELYKTKIENEELNESILKMINILEKNKDKYIDEFPIKINPFEFTYSSEESITKFKENYKISKEANAEGCFYFLKEKYKIKNENIEEIRKILIVRYSIFKNGYSSTRPITIAQNISNTSINELRRTKCTVSGNEYSFRAN